MKIVSFRLLPYIVLLALCSVCPAGSLPDKPDLLWNVKLGSEPSGTPAVNSNIIVAVTANGQITAITLDGKRKWSRTIENASFSAAPIVHGDLAIIGSSEGVLYAVSLEDGKTIWSYSTDGLIQGKAVSISPDSVAFVDQPTGRLYCIDTQSGKLKWKSKATNRCDGYPSSEKGVIVFGNCDAAVHIFSAKSGKLMRSIALGAEGQVAGGVSIDNGNVAAGTYGGNLTYADIYTGDIVWTFTESDASTHAAPAIDEKNVVVASEGGTVYCLDRKSGEIRWQLKLKGTPTSPIIEDSRIIIGADGILYILSLDSASKLWSYEVSDEITSPVLINSMVIVAGDDGTVSAFGAKK